MKRITEADAIEFALDFAGLERGRDFLIQRTSPNEDGEYYWIVEITSDITVLVDQDGNCRYKNKRS